MTSDRPDTEARLVDALASYGDAIRPTDDPWTELERGFTMIDEHEAASDTQAGSGERQARSHALGTSSSRWLIGAAAAVAAMVTVAAAGLTGGTAPPADAAMLAYLQALPAPEGTTLHYEGTASDGEVTIPITACFDVRDGADGPLLVAQGLGTPEELFPDGEVDLQKAILIDVLPWGLGVTTHSRTMQVWDYGPSSGPPMYAFDPSDLPPADALGELVAETTCAGHRRPVSIDAAIPIGATTRAPGAIDQPVGPHLPSDEVTEGETWEWSRDGLIPVACTSTLDALDDATATISSNCSTPGGPWEVPGDCGQEPGEVTETVVLNRETGIVESHTATIDGGVGRCIGTDEDEIAPAPETVTFTLTLTDVSATADIVSSLPEEPGEYALFRDIGECLEQGREPIVIDGVLDSCEVRAAECLALDGEPIVIDEVVDSCDAHVAQS